MPQFDKYIKIAQEMIFEGAKGKKNDLYLSEDGNMHGGSIFVSNKGNKNAKIKEIILIKKSDKGKKLNLSNLLADLNNLATVTKEGDKFKVSLKDDDVIEFTTTQDYTTESGEGFYLKIS